MSIYKTIFSLLTFRMTRDELLQLNEKHLIAGLTGAWLVGMGRYWDDPDAYLLQHLGLGSVIYIFCLSLFIWLIIKPYFIDHWKYSTVLIFVSLTSFPAALYAIPVERFFDIETAISINIWFLSIVATWRLALLYFFLKRFSQLNHGYIIVGTLLPICLIVVALTFLNLERAVFNIMGGVRRNSANAAYEVLITLTVLSAVLVIPLLLGYIIGIYNRWKIMKKKKLTEQSEISVQE